GEPGGTQGPGARGRTRRARHGRRAGPACIGRSAAVSGSSLLVALGVLLPCVAGAVTDTQVHYVMGTYLRITADGDGAAAGMQACFQDVRRLDDVFSRWTPTSELSRLNAAAPGELAVSADMGELVRRSLALSDATGGAFDVAVGPLTALWRRPEPPHADELAAAPPPAPPRPGAHPGGPRPPAARPRPRPRR